MSDTSNPSSVLTSFAAAQRVMAALEDSDGQPLDGSDLPKVAGYVLGERLGAGGGGEVYRAVRDGSDRPVALKLLRRTLGSDATSQRAWRELQALEEVRLPCVPRVHDYGEAEGRLYIVTDLIKGMPLDEHCQSHALDVAARVELLASVADAVQLLHEHGVIHRDLKPSNIIITSTGQPVIIDLGLAVLMTADVMQSLTEDGTPIGSPAFMSPEQARGERRAVSTRSDVYSLGAIGYQLIVGDTPHDMQTSIHEAIRRVSQDEPREPRQVKPSLPKPLAAMLRQAVAVDPAKRYGSAGAFTADLRRWLRRECVHAQTPSPLQRIITTASKHPAVSTAVICLLIAVGILTGTLASVWWYNAAPYGIQIDPNESAWVRLVARSGNILHTWDSGVNNGIRDAAYVQRPPELGGGAVVLIVASTNARASWAAPGAMTAFSTDDPHVPLWTTGIDATDITFPIGMPYADQPNTVYARSMMIEDVFPELPGQEIISIHFLETWSPCLLRITNLNGEVLFERWHRGYHYAMHWMESPRLLILASHDNTHSWAERGFPEATVRYPAVIMAVAPSLNDGDAPNAITPDMHWNDVQIEPEWRRALLPHTAVDTLKNWQYLRHPPGRYDASTHVLWLMRMTEKDWGVHWILNDRGDVVERIISDKYLVGDFPDASKFYLGDLPPVQDNLEK